MCDAIYVQAWTSDGTAATLFEAERAIDEAIAALEDAGVALTPLLDETDWQSRGVRALNEELRTIATGVAAEIAQLRSRVWELEGVPAA